MDTITAGRMGGIARRNKLTPQQMIDIARKGASKRWTMLSPKHTVSHKPELVSDFNWCYEHDNYYSLCQGKNHPSGA